MNYTPQKIIYNGAATIVFWADGSKTVVKCAKGTKPDKYNAFCAALAKKVYGSNTRLKKCIKEAESAKHYKAEPDTELKVGDKVRILDGANIPDYIGGWVKSMAGTVGGIDQIKIIENRSGDRKAVALAKHIFTYDLRGLEKVGDNES